MMQLQSLVTQTEILADGWSFNNNQFNLLPTFRYLLKVDAIHGANIFHGTLVAGLSEWIAYWANKLSSSDILLSGECFLNKVVSEGLQKQLAQKGLNVFLPQRLPPDDAGLSLGQAWIAGIR
jgi:hydrogenase maturation protein HypF